MLTESLTWFRAQLSSDQRALRAAPVRIFVMGANQWRDYDDWPPRPERLERWRGLCEGISVLANWRRQIHQSTPCGPAGNSVDRGRRRVLAWAVR